MVDHVHYAAALERIAFLEARNTELQAANSSLLVRAREAEQDGFDQKLRVAALNIYKMDWVWAHRGDGEPHLIGSKFWINLRDALGLSAVRENKWNRDQQRAAMSITESHSPTHVATTTASGLRPGRMPFSPPPPPATQVHYRPIKVGP